MASQTPAGWLPVLSPLEHHFTFLTLPSAAGFLHPIYFRRIILRFLDTQPAPSPHSLPTPCSREARSALRPWEPRKGAEAAQKRSQEVSLAPTSIGKGGGGCSPAVQSGQTRGRAGGDPEAKICWKEPGPVPSTCPMDSKEPRHEITPTTLQKCLFPVTLARHGRQQLGHLSFYLLPPIAPDFRSEISTARFPRLGFMVAHVSCSAAISARVPVPHWMCCLHHASAFLPKNHL